MNSCVDNVLADVGHPNDDSLAASLADVESRDENEDEQLSEAIDNDSPEDERSE